MEDGNGGQSIRPPAGSPRGQCHHCHGLHGRDQDHAGGDCDQDHAGGDHDQDHVGLLYHRHGRDQDHAGGDRDQDHVGSAPQAVPTLHLTHSRHPATEDLFKRPMSRDLNFKDNYLSIDLSFK